ncbi:MAG: hypothetical protein SFW09_05090 [Hyphomicrobiaceae bacterium]|nr:hypothetical protein [Hyphomicrobiaceae bacterium]
MLRANTVLARPRAADITAREVVARLDAGEDPRRAIAHLNAQIIAFQCAGAELPVGLIQLSRSIAAECSARYRRRLSA